MVCPDPRKLTPKHLLTAEPVNLSDRQRLLLMGFHPVLGARKNMTERA